MIELKKVQKLTNEKIKLLLNSNEWVKLNKLIEKKRNVEDEISKLKDDIIRIISGFEKVFRKLKRLVYDGKEQLKGKKYIESYIDSPIDSLKSDKELKILYLMLECVRRCILTNTIKLQNEKREKVLSQINEVLKNNILKTLVKKYESLKNDKDIIKNKINELKIIEEKKTLENKLEVTKREIVITKTNIEELGKKNEMLKNEIGEMKIKLERSLNKVIDRKVKVII